ncbi:MAG: anhydro-N-acetylmuramic acid kinase [Bacteroidales bacterium]|nr:anhydro-N-acetylmuramic acid kinase [Bacteroidales bacterium]
MKKSMTSIGLMSGTSVDGLDVCCATFTLEDGKWSFHIDCARGYDYPADLKKKLGKDVQNMSAYEFVAFHSEYGRFLGQRVNDFLAEFKVKPDIIASHGSTVFHEPGKRIMYQIGDGAAIAAETGIPTVSDFRRLDIMLGGQGAPLVPVGDNLLFGQYDYCLNIGGFSNISWREGDKRIAFDISPVNYVINRFCRSIGLEMDRDGVIASRGTVHQPLLDALNALDYYSKTWPKSLGREWVEANVFPLLDASGLSLEDLLRTYYEHCAQQLARVTKPGRSLLVTGGGAYNKFLIERMRELSGCNIVVPEPAIIEFKEALIFAFLGVLYMFDQPSCLRSVTGASRDNIGGMLFKV